MPSSIHFISCRHTNDTLTDQTTPRSHSHNKTGRILCAKLSPHCRNNNASRFESNEDLKLAAKVNLVRKIGGIISPFSSSPTQAPGLVNNSSVDEISQKRYDTPGVSAAPYGASTARTAGPGHDSPSAIPTQTLLPTAATLKISPISISVPVGSASASNRVLKQQLPALSSPVAAKRRNSSMVQDFSTATEVLYSYSGSEGCPGQGINHTEFCSCIIVHIAILGNLQPVSHTIYHLDFVSYNCCPC